MRALLFYVDAETEQKYLLSIARARPEIGQRETDRVRFR